uniref:ELM2 domain-containing protein n=1 Tax=Ixodes ricinus TaxID=34613 RepID=A0A090XA84_IXORI
MDKPAKRQWMQSVNGKIRVGPNYQAMIPPFCRTVVPNNGSYESHVLEHTQGYGSASNGVSKNVDCDSKNIPMKGPSTVVKNDNVYIAAEDFLISK